VSERDADRKRRRKRGGNNTDSDRWIVGRGRRK